MSEEKNSSPGSEEPNLTPQQTGQSNQAAVEGDEQDNVKSQGQSTEAPATG
jgi:hypothetical protein